VNGGVHAPGWEEPLSYWIPTSIAPSGLAFYTGTLIPQWTGSLFTGALAGRALWRLTLSGNTVTAREALYADLGNRIRDVRQGPDGRLYLLTDATDGKLIRIGP
jgi:aldose sugar dehydrogenase